MDRRHPTWRWLVLLPAAMSLAANGPDLRLVQAAAKADVSAVRALIKQGVNVNTPYGDGATPLHWAVHRNNLDIADLLIRAGAAVNATNDLGATPLWLAGENGNAEMTERLLKAGAKPNISLTLGETPLMVAARSGNARVVKLLADAGADVNAKEKTYGQTALMWAAVEGHAEAVKVLLAVGADPNVHTKPWLENVQYAGGSTLGVLGDDVVLPQEHRGGYSPLIFAARNGDVATAAALVEGGANINDTAANGATALVVAAHSGNGKFGAFLLDKGADANLDGAGYSALHAAILRRDLELVKALVSHGADPNAKIRKAHAVGRSSDDYALTLQMIGATAFWQAAAFKELEIMRVLVAHGADPLYVMSGEDAGADPTGILSARGQARLYDERQEGGKTALAALIARGDSSQMHDSITDESKILEAVKYLVSLGVDVNRVDNQNGDAPLHIAALRRFNSVVQYLVDNRATLDLKNRKGQTPLAVASNTAAGKADDAGVVADLGQSDLSTAALLRKLGAKE